MPQLTIKLPPLYHQFLPDFIHETIPDEKVATCDNCVMNLSPKSTNINTKCCVYYAELPNYLLGGLLQDQRESLQEGKKRALAIINSKLGVTPYGIRKPSWYRKFEKEKKVNKQHTMTQEEKETLRCPFYGDDGGCTTWAYREHCCSTHFCFSVSGDKGQKFWKKLDNYMHQTERKLAMHIAKQLGCTHSFVDKWLGASAIRPDRLDQSIDEQKYQALWAGWKGSEVDFYLQAYEYAQSLTQEDYLTIMGENWEEITQVTHNLLKDFQAAEFPDLLIWNTETQVSKIPDTQKVTLTTALGNMEVPISKLPILQAFNGKRTLTEVAHLSFKMKLSIAKDISKLFELNILKPVS